MLSIDTRPNRRAFTLVEMLIVTAILGIVSLTLYSALSSGIRVLQRVRQPAAGEDVVLFLEKFTSDMRNAFVFKGLTGKGESGALMIPTLVTSTRLQNTSVGMVSYTYNKEAKSLKREIFDYAAVANGEEPQSVSTLSGLEDLTFHYFIFDSQKRMFVWADEWDGQSGLPKAVRMEFTYLYGTEPTKIVRTVGFPESAT
ncbi:MAG TPA: type II secretion system protein GspJ [Candidatus Omnitrophota bacterium]|nr:type II secretion system protein GspJ [Candidatus Omnitrophota bacterium]HPT07937.1 type II secretion system protein GspJ [Candidatus Omnitrophota bacterium]